MTEVVGRPLDAGTTRRLCLEDVAELAIGGTMPIFGDDVFASDPVDPLGGSADVEQGGRTRGFGPSSRPAV